MTWNQSRLLGFLRLRETRRAAAAATLALSAVFHSGCGREFFRQWANQDVTEAIFEKSRDPRFRIDMFSVDPPALSRFSQPFDPDFPPAPPDDPAASELSVQPQRPKFQLVSPAESAGYLDMLETWLPEHLEKENEAREERRKIDEERLKTESVKRQRDQTDREAEKRANEKLDQERDRILDSSKADTDPTPNPDPDRDPNASPDSTPDGGAPSDPNAAPAQPGAASDPSAGAGASKPPSVSAIAARRMGPLASLLRRDDSQTAPRPGRTAAPRRDEAVARAQSESLDLGLDLTKNFGTKGIALTPKEVETLNRHTPMPPELPPGRRHDPGSRIRAFRAAEIEMPKSTSPSRTIRLNQPPSPTAASYGSRPGPGPVAAQPSSLVRGPAPLRVYAPNRPPLWDANDLRVLRTQNEAAPNAQPQPQPDPSVPGQPGSLPTLAPNADPPPPPDGAAATPPSAPQPAADPEMTAPGRLPDALTEDQEPASPVDNDAADDQTQTNDSSSLSSGVLESYEAIGVSRDTKVYHVNLEQAITLGLINSRSYQDQLENVYASSLVLTLERFNLQPQFYAGLSPRTGTAAGINSGGANRFFYRTEEAPGGQASTLTLSGVAGAGKVFANGARLLASFASQVSFNFLGPNPQQPSIQSSLPISVVLPLLRNGGKAVVLEDLSQSERNVLYAVRDFTRFRQQFLTSVCVGGQAGGAGDPSVGYLPLLRQYLEVENTRRNVRDYERLLNQFVELSQGEPSGIADLNVGLIRIQAYETRSRLLLAQTQLRQQLDRYKIQLGLPPDTPWVLDRGLIEGFENVFQRVERWSQKEPRELEELQGIVADLPGLEDIIISGRSVLKTAEATEKHEDLLLAAQRIALENRLDLMNARARLYDSWRQLAVTANALQGFLDVSVSSQIFTPPGSKNIFALNDQAKDFSLTFNYEPPLIRLAERNQFRNAQLVYQRAQRTLMQQEDNVKLQVRDDLRLLMLAKLQLDINVLNLFQNIKNLDNALLQLTAPPAAGGASNPAAVLAQTQTIISEQQRLLNTQNTLIQTWITYQTQRLNLYRDLGTMPYDEWEAFYELFPRRADGTGPGGSADADVGSAPAANPSAPSP